MNQVDVTEASRMAGDTHILVDVREQEEWDAGHAVGATHMPLSGLSEDDFDANKAYLLICRSGQRSGQAVMALAQRGYDAINVAGGTKAWKEADLPMASENGQPPIVLS